MSQYSKMTRIERHKEALKAQARIRKMLPSDAEFILLVIPNGGGETTIATDIPKQICFHILRHMATEMGKDLKENPPWKMN